MSDHPSAETDLDYQPRSKECTTWGLYQWGRLWGVYRTRREAVIAAIASTHEPWTKTKKYFRIQRVKVTPL